MLYCSYYSPYPYFSGKTGATENYKHRGIIPRGIESLFKEIRNRSNHSAVTVRISYLEIYNETLYDLLSSLPSAEQQTDNYKIVEDGKGKYQRVIRR